MYSHISPEPSANSFFTAGGNLLAADAESSKTKVKASNIVPITSAGAIKY
jgi:hypothetical protein